MSDRVTISIDDRGIADVRLNRPEKRNALDGAMFAGSARRRRAAEERAERPRRRAVRRGRVVLRRPRLLVVPVDGRRRPVGGAADGNPGAATPGGITHLGQQVAWVWQELPVPVIAAVHGHALGGGIQIALGADIRIVHPDAQLSVREVHWGLVPDMTGTLFLSRLVGPDVAKELTFTARIVSGREAGELGLATHVSETPREDAMALAARSPGAAPRPCGAPRRCSTASPTPAPPSSSPRSAA